MFALSGITQFLNINTVPGLNEPQMRPDTGKKDNCLVNFHQNAKFLLGEKKKKKKKNQL